jgi:hypothetical protein
MPIGPFTSAVSFPDNVPGCLDLLTTDAIQRQQMDQTDLASHLISEFFNTNISAFVLYDQTEFVASLSSIKQQPSSSGRASSTSSSSSSATPFLPPPPEYLLNAMFAATAAKSSHPDLFQQNQSWTSPETAAAYWADLAFNAITLNSSENDNSRKRPVVQEYQTMLILVDYYNSQQDIQKCLFLMFELIKVAKFHSWGKLAVDIDFEDRDQQPQLLLASKIALMFKLVWVCVFWVKRKRYACLTTK